MSEPAQRDVHSKGTDGQEGALAALREVAAEGAMQKEFPLATELFTSEDQQHLIALAWRHQFDTDRSRFKREIRHLQDQISALLLRKMEKSS